MDPGAKRAYLGRAFRAIVEKTVHLRNGLHHSEVSVRHHARDDRRGIFIRVDDGRFKTGIVASQLCAQSGSGRHVANAHVGREKKRANYSALPLSPDSSARTKKSSSI